MLRTLRANADAMLTAMAKPRPNRPLNYLVALLAIGVATVARAALPLHQVPYLLFIPTIFWLSLVFGLGVGLFATVLSAVLATLLFLGPPLRPHIALAQVVTTGLYVLFCAGIALVCDVTRRSLARQAEELARFRALQAVAAAGERARSDSEEFLRRVLSSSTDSVVVQDMAGAILYMNPGVGDGGDSPEPTAAAERGWFDGAAGEASPAARDALAAARSGGTGRFQSVRADAAGEPRWWDVVVSPLLGAANAPERVVSVARDITDTVLAQRQLALSEESLRLATETAGIGTWDLDMKSGVLTWSARTRAMFGMSGAIGLTIDDFYAGLHPDDRDAIAAAFQSAIDPALRATYDVEFRTVGRDDGVVRWVAASGRGLFEDGLCHRAIGTAIDITERKSAVLRERFLLGLLDRLRNIADAAAVIDVAISALGEYLGADRVGYGQVQADNATVMLETCYAKGVEAVTGAFALDAFGAHHIRRQRQGLTVVIDDVLDDPVGERSTWTEIDTRAVVSVPLVRDGRFRASLFVNHRHAHAWTAGEIAVIEDVARRLWDAVERARAEEALRQVNASLERQVDARTRERDRTWRVSPLVMVVGGPDGRLLEANPAWTQCLGWTAEETYGRDVMDFVAQEDRELGASGMARLFDGEPVIDLKLNFLTRDGRRRCIAWTTVPDGGRLYGFGTDVTDQMLAEDRLRQAQKMDALGQLTGGIAHDFNNLLAGVSGSLELLDMRLRQGRLDGAHRLIEMGIGASRRAAALTHRLLAFARRQTLAPVVTNVNELVAGMEELISRTIGPDIDLEVYTDPGLWPTLIDPPQLENALLNLCLNARDATLGPGRIIIRTLNVSLDESEALQRDLPPGDYVSLSVTDTGIGMAPEIVERVYDPFFTTKPLGQGTGLGLSMIFGFMRQSGGHVRIDSAVGAGTTVFLHLPRCEAAGPPAAEPRAEAVRTDRGSGQCVLVIDDEPSVRDFLAAALADAGYEVIEAIDGPSGLEILRSARRIDLLVTDVGLPGGLNGREVADAARNLRPNLRVLFVTGYAQKMTLDAAQLGHGTKLLIKPFDLQRLYDTLREMMSAAPLEA